MVLYLISKAYSSVWSAVPGTLFDMNQITVVVSRVTLLVCKISSPVTAMCSHRYVEATVCVCVAIILTLTFELAMQIGRECRKFSKALELHVVCVYGGTGISEQIAELKRGAEVIVCTPGRMIDMLAANSGMIYTASVSLSVCLIISISVVLRGPTCL